MEHRFTSSTEKDRAATRTLESLGYAYHGGEVWKPPVGQPPAYITWDGKGQPPVGTVCEVKPASDIHGWELFKVVGSEDGCVFGFKKRENIPGGRPTVLLPDDWEFRKYETPEERAARRKAEACDVIASLLMADSAFSDDASRIYDAIAAGKIPGVPALRND